MGWFSNSKQRQVLRLEPSRGANAIGGLLVFVVTSSVSTAAVLYATDAWPASFERPDFADISDRTVLIVAAVAALFALLAAASAIYDFSRWRLSRMVIKASRAPSFRGATPQHETVVAQQRAPHPPPLQVTFRKPRHFPKTPKPLQHVSPDANVIGRPPINIVYLRLFDNQPRARTFMESAWREFGYVFLLRSATSVTRREFKRVRRLQSLSELFVHDDDTFGSTLQVAPASPLRKGRVVLPDVAPTRVRVRDRFGSYPVRAVLCHGEYWRRAIDLLLAQVHLVVLDLSGFTERNAATAYELQRTIDCVPIDKVILLCDPASSRKFLERAIQQAWSQMSASSPNAAGGPRAATVAITDSIRRYRSQQGNQEFERVKLEGNRRHSRRVATAAQFMAEPYRSQRHQPAQPH